jgi:hypothetical protein
VKVARTALALGALLMVGQAVAHHSAAMFDRSRKVTVTGTVVKFQWVNPHSWIDLNVRAEDGTTVLWSFEAGTPGQMRPTGLTPEVLKIGDTVTITGYPLRDGRTAAAYVQLVTANGTLYNTRAQGQTPQGPLVREDAK